MQTLTETRRITIKDVALRAQVGHPSVSVVLNGGKGPHVAEATRQRILAAAEELGYKRNGNMAAARSGKFKAVGLLLSTCPGQSTLPQNLWSGIQDELAMHDIHLIAQKLPDAQLTDEKFVPKMLREWMCDGLIIDYTHGIPQRLMELLQENQMPAIWVNAKLPHDCVYPDDFEAGKRAVERLIRLGHRRITYACHLDRHQDNRGHYSVEDRRNGCRAAMEAAGLKFEAWAPSDELLYGARLAQWVAKFKSPDRPTAVISYGGYDGDVAMHAAEVAGWSVPDDVSTVIFGGNPHGLHGLRITRMVIPENEVGRTAVKKLLQKIESPPKNIASCSFAIHCRRRQNERPRRILKILTFKKNYEKGKL